MPVLFRHGFAPMAYVVSTYTSDTERQEYQLNNFGSQFNNPVSARSSGAIRQTRNRSAAATPTSATPKPAARTTAAKAQPARPTRRK